MNSGRMGALAMLALLMIEPTAAISAEPVQAAQAAQTEAADDADPYLLSAGDKLRITVFNEASLTGEYAVTAAGNISFPLIGNVGVRRKSIENLQEELTKRLGSGYLNDPKVSIEVLNYRPFYILGEVNKPGEYPYVAGLTLEQAVAAAGGYTYRANRKKLFVRSASAAEDTKVDVRKGINRVHPGDTIRVGERYF